ncbi:MAG: NAD(P)-binding domain-containing protein [Deltaproteobacteria bacterium]|nr:NAD(P)-binding domain-containing protein [Deltaproteobacteria bacterium]
MASDRLVERYLRDPAASLKHNAAIALSDKAIAAISSRARFIDLLPGERLSAKVDRDARGERYYLIAEGQVGVCRAYSEIDTQPLEVKVRKGTPGHERPLLAYLTRGEVFSDGYVSQMSSGSGLDVAALMETVLVAVDRHALAEVMAKLPDFEDSLRDRVERTRARVGGTRDPARRVPQDFFLRHNYSFATTLKVIDLEACIGCDGCERACESRHGTSRLVRKGPVLGSLAFPIACRTCVDHRCLPACGFDSISLDPNGEVRINQKTCVGCTACQAACPNGVIEMVETPYTVADFPRPLPNTDNDGRTNVEGLFLIGEASGTALIKLAINGGVRAIEAIAKELQPSPPGPSPSELVDVAIVGAGPGGLSAALSAREKGFSFHVFDKGAFATTLQSYPRKKLVMAEPAHIPLYGSLWMKDASKEEIIERWNEILTTTGLEIRSNEEVTQVKKAEDGNFDVTTPKGKYRARRAIMATGNRGSPRKLGVAGEGEPRVQYTLTEPEEFRGKHLLVVGGGDSAVEGAMSLAEIPGTTVAISYRQDKFGRIKAKNKDRIEQFEREKKLEVILSSTVKALEDGVVVLSTPAGSRRLNNDVVFAMLGAEPPTKLFQGAGIEIIEPGTEKMGLLAQSRGSRFFANKCDHCAEHGDQACITACPTDAIFELRPSDVFVDPNEPDAMIDEARFREGLERAGRSLLKSAMPYILAAIALVTVALGLECFLRAMMPERSLEGMIYGSAGVTFESGRGLGFYLGIAGLGFMALTSAYPLNSRLGWLRKLAKTRIWLVLHIALGFMGPALVTYHTRMKLDRWPTIAFAAMWAVVLSGALGRYLFTWFRRSSGLADLENLEIDHSRAKAIEDAKGISGRTRLFAMSSDQGAELVGLLAPIALLWHQLNTFFRGLKLRYVELADVDDPALRRRALELFQRRAKNQRSRLFLGTAEKSAAVWRRIHLFATIALFVVAALHVVVALMYRTT